MYVHIPFCRNICPFCPYNKVLYRAELADRYHHALLAEIAFAAEQVPDGSVSSLYFGGGTPALTPATVASATELLRPKLRGDAAVGIELHPSDVTTQMLASLKEAGVTMVSLGVQSLRDDLLGRLGRDHNAKQGLAAVERALDADFCAVNADLLTGVPGQRHEQVIEDFGKLLSLGVGQVSAYPLMDFSFTRRKSKLSLVGQWRGLTGLEETASKYGYRRSSVWTWTYPGYPHYTSVTRESFIGIGAGAATYLDGYFAVNTFDVEAYIHAIEAKGSPVALHAALTGAESALYWLFWRCYEGEIDLKDPAFARITNINGLLRIARSLGLVSMSGGRARLTHAGYLAFHVLEGYYTRTYIETLWRTCHDKPFPQGLRL